MTAQPELTEWAPRKEIHANIRTCINEALGNEAWMIGDIASRMVRVRVVGQESETITLDGKPLLEIWPPEIKNVQEGNSWKMVATVKYRTFKAQNW